MKRSLVVALALLAALVVLLAVAVVMLNLRGEDRIPAGPQEPGLAQMSVEQASVDRITRGGYLARAGNCAGCHTARGGGAFAGGFGVQTPFGTVYASNLTPDDETGIGRWSAAQFWRAMHNGRSRDGRLLYPAFPYPQYTHVTRADSDAIFAYLRSLAPINQPNRGHELRFPYGTQAALAVWRALFFKPGVYVADPTQSPEWNRGAYLVHGLGHCNACHAPRNALGAIDQRFQFAGGLIPLQNWYAPPLASSPDGGVADWQARDIVALLGTGISPHGSAMGPMAQVVFDSTQHLSKGDLHAIAAFLRTLPPVATSAAAAPGKREPGWLEWLGLAGASRGAIADGSPVAGSGAGAEAGSGPGARLYADHCDQCHGRAGQGAADAYPSLAGNYTVMMDSPTNLIRVVLDGGFAPATAGNPRPYGMPPFAPQLDDAEIAALLSYVRTSWGNRASPVGRLQVLQIRERRGK